MNVHYLGHSSFLITSKTGVRIVTDPYQGVGYDMPKNISADIVTVSHEHFDHNYLPAVQGGYTLIKGEGNWNEKGVSVCGKNTFHDEKQGSLRGNNTVFTFVIDGIRVSHLGDLGEPCNEVVLDKIGQTDVILIPIGGKYTIDALQAKAYIEKLSPKVAIAMHYKPPQGSLDISNPQAFLSLFEHVIKAEQTSEILITKKEDTKSVQTQIVFMEIGEKICLKA